MLNKLFTLFLTIVLLTPVVLAVSLRDIEIYPEEIELDDSFEVEVTFSGDTCGTQVKFFIDDILFSSKNVGHDVDSIESSEWDLSDNPLDCGKHIVKVELMRGDEIIDNISQEISIGNSPLITFPERPMVNEEFKINFRDSDTGEFLDGLGVEIYNLRESIKNRENYFTDANGDIVFKSQEAGEFRLVIDDSGYCGSRNFYVKKSMNTDGPYPASPVVGELITIVVPSGVGVKVLDASGEVYTTGSTSIGGGVNLTINDPGGYLLVMGELHNVYWGRNISLNVSKRLKPSIVITPKEAVNGRELTIKVNAGGEPLSYTDVTLQKPSGGTEEYETNENGELKLTPTSTGRFLVRIDKQGYKASESAFEVRNLFDVVSTPKEPMVGEDITLFVRDQSNNLVQGATVSVQDTPYGTSGLDGRFALKLSDPGKYAIKVTRQDYWDFTYDIMVLSPLHLELDFGEIELGESITLKVVDAMGSDISADIEVTKPDGVKESIGKNYEPGIVGEYKITASKEMYIGANNSFTVNPHPLNLDLELIGDRLIINVTSHEEPVPNINLIIQTPTGIDKLVTDNEGKAEVRIEKDGEVNISANVADTNPNYDKSLSSRKVVRRHDISILVIALTAVVLVTLVVYAASGKRLGIPSRKRDKQDKKDGGRKPTLSRL